MKKRKILVALWDQTLENVMWAELEIKDPVGKAITLIAALLNNYEQNSVDYKVEQKPEAYKLFDWFCKELPEDILVSQVPKPGVIIAINKKAALLKDQSDNKKSLLKDQSDNKDAALSGLTVEEDSATAYTFALLIRRNFLEDQTKKTGQRAAKFFASEESKYEPTPLNVYDVFISFSSPDKDLANEITESFKKKRTKMFFSP
jgi:hypothetical protein